MSSLLKKIGNWYSHLFSVEEIADSQRLRYFFISSWALCIYDFTSETRNIFTGNGTLRCWPYYDGCNELLRYFLPNSYLYNLWAAFILSILFFAAISFARRRYALAHSLLLFIIIYKAISTFILINKHNTNFAIFHLFPSFIFLISKNKIQSLKYCFAFIYFFTPRVKFDEGWILGTYFSSTINGLPLFPDSLIPAFTNLTIICEMIFAIGLFHPNKNFQKTSLWAWTIFHLYSAIIVEYFYPVRCLVFLWVIYGLDDLNFKENQREEKIIDSKAAFILAIFTFINFLPNLISKRPNITNEGLEYGFHMINANYQCQTTIKATDSKKNVLLNKTMKSTIPMNRCFIFDIFQQIKAHCKSLPPNTEVEWTYWQSSNGSPFYELINEQNVCNLSYKPFSHNEWIKYPDNSLIKGYPSKNNFGRNFNKDKDFINLKAIPQEDHSSFWRANYKNILTLYQSTWYIGLIYFLYLGFILPLKNKKN